MGFFGSHGFLGLIDFLGFLDILAFLRFLDFLGFPGIVGILGSDLEPVELLSTGPDRPVEILDLTGKKPAKTGKDR
jgi:hypothetical protein